MTTTMIRLPWPVSANRYWRSFVPKGHRRAIVTRSDEATDYIERVRWIWRAQRAECLMDRRVALAVHLYPHRPQDAAARQRKHGQAWDDTVGSIDLDNALKVLIDALKGIAYTDDKWVRRIVAERMEPIGEAHVQVAVGLWERADPQAGLFGGMA